MWWQFDRDPYLYGRSMSCRASSPRRSPRESPCRRRFLLSLSTFPQCCREVFAGLQQLQPGPSYRKILLRRVASVLLLSMWADQTNHGRPKETPIGSSANILFSGWALRWRGGRIGLMMCFMPHGVTGKMDAFDMSAPSCRKTNGFSGPPHTRRWTAVLPICSLGL